VEAERREEGCGRSLASDPPIFGNTVCFVFKLVLNLLIIHAEHVVQSAWILFSLWMYVCMLAL